MRVVMKSMQDFGTHTDESEEKDECVLSRIGESLLITFQNGNIQLEGKKITYIRGNNMMEIEEGKMTEFEYETEEGVFTLNIAADSVECFDVKEGIVAKTKYKVLVPGCEPYTNELEITLEE